MHVNNTPEQPKRTRCISGKCSGTVRLCDDATTGYHYIAWQGERHSFHWHQGNRHCCASSTSMQTKPGQQLTSPD